MEFDELILLLVEKSGLSKSDLQTRINKKKEDLNQLVTEEGAAYIVARELGIEVPTETFVRPTIEIKDLLSLKPGIGSVTITGRIMRIYALRTFKKEERSGSVQRLSIADKTGEIELVLWNQTTQLISEGLIERGDVIRVVKGYLKEGYRKQVELHLSRSGKIETVNEVDSDSKYPELEVVHLATEPLDTDGENKDYIGIITLVGTLKTFQRENSEGKVTNHNLWGAETPIRAVFWNERADEALKFERGDEILIEGGQLREGRQGTPEIHISGQSRVTKTGKHQNIDDNIPSIPLATQKNDLIEKTSVKDLKDGERGLSFRIRLLTLGKTRDFNKKDKSTGSVSRSIALLPDGNPVTLVFWDNKTAEIKNVTLGTQIIIENASTRAGYGSNEIEIHIGSYATIKNDESDDIPNSPPMTNLKDLQAGQIGSTTAVLTNISQKTEFTRKDNTIGHVISGNLFDGEIEARLVCWDESAENLPDELKPGTVIDLIVANVKKDLDKNQIELHVNSPNQTKIKREPSEHMKKIQRQVIKEKQDLGESEQSIPRKTIIELSEGKTVEIKAMIVKVVQRTPYYLSCPHCGKKSAELGNLQGECVEHGTVSPQKRFLIPIILDDSTGSIRTVLIGRTAEKALGSNSDLLEIEDDEKLQQQITEMLSGSEFLFTGQTTLDSFRTNETEDSLVFRIQRIQKINYGLEFSNVLKEIEHSF